MKGRSNILHFGPFTRDRSSDCLQADGQRIPLTRQALAVLDVLLDSAGELVTKQALIEGAWSRRYVTDDALSKRLQELRRVLGDDARAPRYIETVPRLGFRFIVPVKRLAAEAGQLLGREAELAQLMRWLREVARHQPLMVSIAGEPGIGKSRLIESFLGAVADSASVLRGHCSAHSRLQPFMPVLTALADGARHDEVLRSALMSYAPSWAGAIPELANDVDALPAPSRQRMLLELCTALDHAASAHPQILVIEDIHWADASTLALLDYLGRRRARAALMVVVSFREQGLALSTEAGRLLVNLVGRDAMRSVSLTPFDRATVGRWVQGEFGVGSEELVELLYQHSHGLPLYLNWLIEECRRHLDDAGDFDVATLQRRLPESLGRLFRIQLASLAAAERQILEAGAVIGAPFSSTVIPRLTDLDSGAIARSLHNLIEAGQLVYRTALLDGSYQIAHELLRQAVYNALDEQRRAQLHARFADVLAVSPGVEHGVLAHHHECARRWAEAIESHTDAAHAARATHAALECIDHLEAAIALSQRHTEAAIDHDKLYALHEYLYFVYRMAHGFNRPRVHELVDEIVQLGGSSSKSGLRFQALTVQIGHAMMCGRVPWILDCAGELDQQAEALGDTDSLLEASSLIGEAQLYAGNLSAAMERVANCRRLLETRPAAEAIPFSGGVYRLLALVQVEQGQFASACDSVAQALNAAASPFEQAMGLYTGYTVHALHGDFDGGEPYVARLETIVRQYDFQEIAIWASLARAMVTVETGDPGTALDLAVAGRRLLEERGTNLFRGLAHMVEARACARLGDVAGAYRAADEGIEIARRQGEFGCLANVLFTRGEIGLWLERPEVRDDLVAAYEQARRNRSLLWQLRDLAFLSTVDETRVSDLKHLLRRVDSLPVDVRRIAGRLGLDSA